MKVKYISFMVVTVLFVLLVSCDNSTEPTPSVANPVISPAGGTYATGQTVSITCATEGAQIRYSLDGSTPSETSQLYAAPFLIATDQTVKARAYKEGMTPSQVVESAYTINIPQIPGFAYVQGGDLWIGRAVYAHVSSFYIAIKEVTQAEFINVMGFNPSLSGYDLACPVDSVTWYHAIDYCNRRSNLEGLDPCYTYEGHGTYSPGWPAGWGESALSQQYISCNWQANGYRLPAEMEWMFAAKGGIYTHGYEFAGSNDLNSVAWYWSNAGGTSHIGGLKLPNELGLYDMTGNVHEWCWDIYGDWPSTDVTDYHGASSGWNRCLSGSSWRDTYGGSYLWYRHQPSPIVTQNNFGFRLARTSL